MRRSHHDFGKVGLTDARMARKWSLKMRIAPSAAFRRCMLAGLIGVVGLPLLGDGVFVLHAGFVVEDLQVDSVTSVV
jgi:hypothetical protein